MSSYPPPNPPMIPARWKGGDQTPKAIVMHGTVTPDTPGMATATARFFANETNKTSAHYIVDPTTVIQCVGDHTVAYHCGYNQDSIGVEMCDEETGTAARWDDENSRAIIARAATLVAQLCLAYDIDPIRPSVAELKEKGPHGIYGHNDSRLAFGNTTHSDPIDFPWQRFLKQVHDEIERLKTPAKVETKTIRTKPVQATIDAAKQIDQPKKRKRLLDYIRSLFPGRQVSK